ncbi:MAG: helix-turn-helix transcriptional regulator [Bdellovibrionales bacterium]|nr:helix-turn-helix transcriptional regulator [Bdellovibrionales bacterium]
MSSTFDLSKIEANFQDFPKKSRVANWLNERFYIINDGLGIFFRNQKTRQGGHHIDCIPKFWLYIYGEFKGELTFIRHGEETTLWGKKAVFIPPFSIVHWKFNVSQFDWSSYQGTSRIFKLLPKEPFYFSTDYERFENAEEILAHVLDHQEYWQPMGAEEQLNAVALKVKQYIDRNFESELKISLIAESLGYPNDTITRSFKKMYGVSPSQYLRDMKYYQAAMLITESDKPLKSIAKEVGITNYENFSKSFRNIFHTSPKNFREN